MTTAAMVFGMLPVALGMSEGAELRAPMAITVMGGLTVATLLTIFFVPALYAAWFRVRRQPAGGGEPAGGDVVLAS